MYLSTKLMKEEQITVVTLTIETVAVNNAQILNCEQGKERKGKNKLQ